MFRRRKPEKNLSELQADAIRAAKKYELVEASVERNLRFTQNIRRRIAIPTMIIDAASVPAFGYAAVHEFSQGETVYGVGALALGAVLAMDARSIYRARNKGEYELIPDPMFIPDEWQNETQ